MKQSYRFIYSAVVAMIFCSMATAQVTGDYRSIVNGNWSSVTSWESYNGSAWTAAASAPTTTANVTILSGDTITLDIDATVVTLSIKDSGQLSIATVRTLNGDVTINGSFAVSGGNAITMNGNVTCSGPNAQLKFASNGGKINGLAGKIFTLSNGASLTTATNTTASPGALPLTIVNMTWVVDNSTECTTIIFKNGGNSTYFGSLPNNQIYGNIKFTTASNTTTKTYNIGSDFIIQGNVSFEPGTTAGAGNTMTWNLVGFKFRTTGTSKSVTVSQASATALVITGTADSLFNGFASYNFVPLTNDNCTVNYASTTGTQVIYGGSYQHLTMSGGSAKTLIGNATVNGKLTLTSGSITTGTSTITLGPSASLAVTTGNTLIGNVITSRTLSQGVNDTLRGIGVEINAADAAPGVTSVTRVTGTAQTGNGNEGIKRYFDISPATNAGLNATIVFHYDSTELNNITESDLVLFKSTDIGVKWTLVGGTVDTANNLITLTGVNSFSRWTAGSKNSPLGSTAIPPHFAVNPNSVNFGTIKVGEMKEDSVMITNSGDDILKISDISSTSPEFVATVPSVDIGPGGSFSLKLFFEPISVGSKSGKIIFTHNAALLKDTVTVTGTADPLTQKIPLFAVNPKSVNFGTIKVSAVKADSVTITNGGTDTLKISSIVSTQSEFTVAQAQLIINPSGSFVLKLSFQPTSVGSKTGKIIFTHNAASVKDTVPVSGTADLQSSVKSANDVPTEFAIHQNYPNPFNPSTSILYDLPQESHVVVMVYSVIGQAVKTLVKGVQSTGSYRVVWNGADDNGRQMTSGVYFVRIMAESGAAESNPFTHSIKMLMLK